MSKQFDSVALASRILIGLLFFMSGLGKLAAPAATQGFIASVGLPAPSLAYGLSIAIEIGGSLLLFVGLGTRSVSVGLAAFTLVTGVVFHSNFADQDQVAHFLKNIAIVGGLLQVLAFGPGRFSLDGILARRTLAGVARSAE
jgi:putative oxidoreductase